MKWRPDSQKREEKEELPLIEKLWVAPPSVPVTWSNSQAKAAASSWWQEPSWPPFLCSCCQTWAALKEERELFGCTAQWVRLHLPQIEHPVMGPKQTYLQSKQDNFLNSSLLTDKSLLELTQTDDCKQAGTFLISWNKAREETKSAWASKPCSKHLPEMPEEWFTVCAELGFPLPGPWSAHVGMKGKGCLIFSGL